MVTVKHRVADRKQYVTLRKKNSLSCLRRQIIKRIQYVNEMQYTVGYVNEMHVQYVDHEIFVLLHIRAIFPPEPLRKQTKHFRVGWELVRTALSLTQKTATGLEA